MFDTNFTGQNVFIFESFILERGELIDH